MRDYRAASQQQAAAGQEEEQRQQLAGAGGEGGQLLEPRWRGVAGDLFPGEEQQVAPAKPFVTVSRVSTGAGLKQQKQLIPCAAAATVTAPCPTGQQLALVETHSCSTLPLHPHHYQVLATTDAALRALPRELLPLSPTLLVNYDLPTRKVSLTFTRLAAAAPWCMLSAELLCTVSQHVLRPGVSCAQCCTPSATIQCCAVPGMPAVPSPHPPPTSFQLLPCCPANRTCTCAATRACWAAAALQGASALPSTLRLRGSWRSCGR